jgi:uncharacterized membrane protein YbhN (UPF0104 family)
MSSRTVTTLLIITGALVAVAMLLAAYAGVRDARLSAASVPLLCGVFVCTLGLVLTYAACWWLLMSRLERRSVSASWSMRVFCLSWVGRYLPASIPHYAGRLIAAPNAGMSRSAVAASLAYENLIVLSVTGIGAAVCLTLATFGGRVPAVWIAVGAAIAAASTLALHPRFIEALVDVSSRLVGRVGALRGHILPFHSILPLMCAYASGFLFAGAAYYLACRAIGEAPPVLLAFAAYNLAGAAGMLAVGIPGGLGVREAVVVGIMSVAIEPADALAAAILVRVVSIAADTTPVIAVLSWSFTSRWRHEDAAPSRPPWENAA